MLNKKEAEISSLAESSRIKFGTSDNGAPAFHGYFAEIMIKNNGIDAAVFTALDLVVASDATVRYGCAANEEAESEETDTSDCMA